MTVSVDLYLNGDYVGGQVEWDLSCEEVLGGTGRATLVVQDRTMTLEPEAHWDVMAVLSDGPLAGWIVFRGEVVTEPLELPVGFPWRRWKLDCADYNNELDWRLVGALDGKTWLDTSGLGVFVNIDPFASSLETDRLTVQQLLDHYFRLYGVALETDTYVFEYLSDFLTLTWTYVTLRAALEQLAAYVVGNLQFWIDPDLMFHWVTIPAWQDLAQQIVFASNDATVEEDGLLTPSAPLDSVVFAPAKISDVPGDGTVGGRNLKVEFDGSSMPEQVYVRGATGYVYNAPPIPSIDQTKTVVSVPVVGADGTYQLFITEANTKLWHVDGTGYVSTTYALAAIGGPWPVKFVHVAWSETRHKGGYYWKFLSGPHAGLLADDHTNTLAFYGGIRVEFTPASSFGTPEIGTGGSGWANEATQDPSKRQAFLDAAISTTRALRDSLGGQAIYRGQYPTLRGSITVSGTDGWRVGQLVKITDARLPDALNGKYFVIQRVATKLIPATTTREYVLDFGDGPTSRYSYKSSKPLGADWPPPVNQIVVSAHDLSPGPNSSQTIVGQLVNGSGEPWAISGKVVEWTLEAYTSSGVLAPGEGSLRPTVSVTDGHGAARTTLTTGPTTNLVYFVFASVRAV